MYISVLQCTVYTVCKIYTSYEHAKQDSAHASTLHSLVLLHNVQKVYSSFNANQLENYSILKLIKNVLIIVVMI